MILMVPTVVQEVVAEVGAATMNSLCTAAMAGSVDTRDCTNGKKIRRENKRLNILNSVYIIYSSGQAGQDAQSNGDLQTQPPMLTLKQFLANQDDSISDSDAITKYNEYKQDFRRQQLNEFFVTHKDEEW